MLTFAKQTKIVEIIDSKRAYRDFLHAIEKIAFIFVEVYELQLEIVTNHETQFLAFIEIFRHHMRMKKARKKKETIFNSTFVADESIKRTNEKRQKKNENKNENKNDNNSTEIEIEFFVAIHVNVDVIEFFTNESDYFFQFS